MAALVRWVACVGLCLGIGATGSLFTAGEIPSWYATLSKPGWTPPPAVFPVVWTFLYILIGTALWLLWQAPASPAKRAALIWFAVQLVLNAIWTPIFFGAHAIIAALIVILLLIVAIAMTVRHAFAVRPWAGWLMAPYLVWVCYATTLNAGIVLMN